MASTINASSTANGIVSTADASGILNVQSNGVNTNAQAWVNWSNPTAPSIQSSYNVSSVTYTSTGAWTVNFTNAFADAKYCAVGSATTNVSANGCVVIGYAGGTLLNTKTASACSLFTQSVSGGGFYNAYEINMVFFR